ncbi:unnamed protein product [Rhizophagus irregularis]|uniref:Uncharacterized protein n=1 Tax=Rhizophagus irregularis TaxID=588596 RepID=A0A915ZN88_9GLOM|nr:unnamed protein product [Rhizophagus irregularis]CAB5380877.1 unnamed protein product [Rhizophagus irregularis]
MAVINMNKFEYLSRMEITVFLFSWIYPQYFRFHDNLYALPDRDYDEQGDIKIVVKSVQEENDAIIWNIVPLEP